MELTKDQKKDVKKRGMLFYDDSTVPNHVIGDSPGSRRARRKGGYINNHLEECFIFLRCCDQYFHINTESINTGNLFFRFTYHNLTKQSTPKSITTVPQGELAKSIEKLFADTSPATPREQVIAKIADHDSGKTLASLVGCPCCGEMPKVLLGNICLKDAAVGQYPKRDGVFTSCNHIQTYDNTSEGKDTVAVNVLTTSYYVNHLYEEHKEKKISWSAKPLEASTAPVFPDILSPEVLKNPVAIVAEYQRRKKSLVFTRAGRHRLTLNVKTGFVYYTRIGSKFPMIVSYIYGSGGLNPGAKKKGFNLAALEKNFLKHVLVNTDDILIEHQLSYDTSIKESIIKVHPEFKRWLELGFKYRNIKYSDVRDHSFCSALLYLRFPFLQNSPLHPSLHLLLPKWIYQKRLNKISADSGRKQIHQALFKYSLPKELSKSLLDDPHTLYMILAIQDHVSNLDFFRKFIQQILPFRRLNLTAQGMFGQITHSGTFAGDTVMRSAYLGKSLESLEWYFSLPLPEDKLLNILANSITEYYREYANPVGVDMTKLTPEQIESQWNRAMETNRRAGRDYEPFMHNLLLLEDTFQQRDIVTLEFIQNIAPENLHSILTLHDCVSERWRQLNRRPDNRLYSSEIDRIFKYDETQVRLTTIPDQFAALFAMELPRNTAALAELGDLFSNCVGGYGNRIQEKRSLILALVTPEKSTKNNGCLEFSYVENDIRDDQHLTLTLKQAYGPHNASLSPTASILLSLWAQYIQEQSKGRISFNYNYKLLPMDAYKQTLDNITVDFFEDIKHVEEVFNKAYNVYDNMSKTNVPWTFNPWYGITVQSPDTRLLIGGLTA